MNVPTLILSFTLALAGPAWAADKHAHTPKHGGVVVEGKYGDYELEARPALIRLHVSDHGQPADLSKTSAKLTLLSGSEKQEVVLKPAGDKLEASGTFQVGPGTKAVATVTTPGRSVVNLRFVLK